MKFRFMPGCETTNAHFILRQLLRKYFVKKEEFEFVDLEKGFDRVPRDVVW